MYKKRGDSIRLKDVLARLNQSDTALTHKQYTPVTYPSSDILAAKKVLHRILSAPGRNEISYIKVVRQNIEEL